jgi:hypothetical protein
MPDFDVDAWLDDYQPHTSEARVCTRFDLLTEHTKLEDKLAASGPDGDDRHKLAERIVALETEIAETEKVFKFHDIGGRWLALVGEHPPTKDQLAADPALDHNPDTFPPAVIAESSTEPKLTVRQVERLREKLQMVQWQKIWAATLEANLGMVAVPKSLLAGAVLRLNGASATTAVPKGSPAASSSDE